MSLVLPVHILAGSLGLIAGFVALFASKGAPLHRRIGMVFVVSMLTMTFTGVIVAAVRDAAPTINIPAGLLTAYLVVTGLTTLRPPLRGAHALALAGLAVALLVGLPTLAFGFVALASGGNEDRFVIASSHGYGFVTRFENLTGRNKAGKAMLSLSPGSKVLQPAMVAAVETDRIVAVTSAGHLLAFPVAELPELDKGKGNKIIEIPKAKRVTERVVAVASVPAGGKLWVRSGARTMTLSFKELEEYLGSRGQRGGLLPRGWQKVDGLQVE